MKRKVSDLIAQFFERKGVRHAFGIIGSANSHIFDSIFHNSNIELVCNHHEQACTMAVQTYWKLTGIPSFALVTAGAGSSNAITGVLSAWADSIPCIVISGQENARYITPNHDLRMYGIQGYDSPFAVSKMTKYATRLMNPDQVLFELEKAWHEATTGRPGPCWIDIPMNVQAAMVEEDTIPHFEPEVQLPNQISATATTLEYEVRAMLDRLQSSKRPLLWLGVGVRLANAEAEAQRLVEKLGIPVLLTWSAIDLMSSEHRLVVGRAGIYGQRAANFILQSCDALVAIGTRLSILQVGYDVTELARETEDITVVDIDRSELNKYPNRFNHPVCADAGDFIQESLRQLESIAVPNPTEWVDWCHSVQARFPVIGPEHDDKNGFINSYRFMELLRDYLKPDQVIVTDMGTALLSGHQTLKMTPPQRLLTSQGLGEMGFGLPGAIGASFARDRGEVLCLNCDGGMMMNLQELQTIAHFQLPIKIIVFNNDGYLMIKHTQKAILGGRYSGTDRASGVSCPDFTKLATAFGFASFQIRTYADLESQLPLLQSHVGPAICEVFMDPEQLFHPKVGVFVQPDGTLISPPLEDMSPFLAREVIQENLLVPLHPKSSQIKIDGLK